MKHVYMQGLLCAFALFTLGANAQNMITNPGFETISSCPSSVAQMPNAVGWYNPSGHTGSADLLHTCGGAGWVGVPSNAFGNQNARSGNAYMGLALYYQSTPNFREYAITQVSTTGLIAGVPYRVQFYVSLADNSSLATDDLQFYFSANAPTWSGGNWSPMTTYTPQAAIPSGTFINNKTAWTLIQATFTAAGGERYMTIGNFLSDAATSTQAAGAGSYTTGYVYFDDGDFRPDVVLSAAMGGISARAEGPKVRVAWETLSEDNTDRFEVERSVDGMVKWDYAGEVKGKGFSSEPQRYDFLDPNAVGGIDNFYRIKVVDQNGEAHYTEAVSAVPELKADYLATLRPNPIAVGQTTDVTFVSTGSKAVEVTIIDMQGKQVASKRAECQRGPNTIALPTQSLSSGQYLVRVLGGGELLVQRLVIL